MATTTRDVVLSVPPGRHASVLARLYQSPPADEPGWPDRFGRVLSKWSVNAPPIQTLSLFTGAGGLDVAFHDCGFRIHTMVESDSKCVATLAANVGIGRRFGDVEVLKEDVRTFSLPSARKVDFVIGCPPCQSFSAASRRVNGVNGTQEERGTLFEAYVRLLKKLSPKAFLFENVAGITGAEDGKAWPRIVAAFRRAGYNVFHRILDAADYGTPQHRERMLLVGVRGDKEFRFPAPTHGPDSHAGNPFHVAGVAVKGVALSPEERSAVMGTRYGHLLADIPPGLNYSFYTHRMGHPRPIFAWRSKFSDFLYKADPLKPVRTVKADAGYCTGPFHWKSRYFSIGELKRLQTLPDDYVLEGGRGAMRSQIGNAVPCQLGRILALAVASQVFGAELPFDLRLLSHDHELGFRKRKSFLGGDYQRKAKSAIAKMPASTVATGASRKYRASLKEQFAWCEDEDGPISVCFEVDGAEWKVRLTSGTSRGSGFKVKVVRRDGANWPKGLSRIVMYGSELTEELFTAAWKAVEAELLRSGQLSDLVQLCGYHSYKPALACRMVIRKQTASPAMWKVVQAVVGGMGVGMISTPEELAAEWGVQARYVRASVKLLRRLGYEVRNNNTNPCIAAGRYLVPYCFPTLNPKSIQLHKGLTPQTEKKRKRSMLRTK